MHDRALLENPALIEAACAAAALALENEQLTADLRARLRELVSSRVHVLRVAEEERRAEARRTALAVLTELRAIGQGIHPPILTERGLEAAVRELAALAPLPVTIDAVIAEPPPAPVETTAYFVVAEALANMTKHAGARRGAIRIVADAGRLRVEISDDGRGGADAADGTGLRGIADRVRDSGGVLTITSPPGAGTRVEAVLPCVS